MLKFRLRKEMTFLDENGLLEQFAKGLHSKLWAANFAAVKMHAIFQKDAKMQEQERSQALCLPSAITSPTSLFGL